MGDSTGQSDDAAVNDGYDSSASIRPLTRAFISEVCV